MKHIATACVGIILLLGIVQGGTLLDRPVPWSGTIRLQTLGEVVARMRGWADVDAKQSLRFATPLTQLETAIMIDRLKIANDPRPTYGAVLLAAFREAGYRMALEESENGIRIARLCSRAFDLGYATTARLRKAGDYSTVGIAARLRKGGYRTSKYFTLSLSPDYPGLIVDGLQEDIDAVSRFLGK